MITATPTPDPTALLAQLTADQILARLDALEAEARSLRVLLRSIRARERAAARRASTPTPPEKETGP